MAYTYSKIASVSVGSGGSSSINFFSIPQNYTDLVVKISAQANNSASSSYDLRIAYNGATPTYSEKWIRGSGTAISSVGGTSSSSVYIGEVPSTFIANTFGNVEIYIPNYTSYYYKSFSSDGVTEQNAASAWTTLAAGLWENTSAIASITLTSSANFAQYSTAYLYGIRYEV